LVAGDGLDFNDLDAALWETFGEALFVATLEAAFGASFFGATFEALADFFTGALRALAAGALADAVEPPRAAFAVRLAGVLEDFLRVFLDIRLPFVAFRGSTNRVLRVSSRAIGFAPIPG
jgi:hypothetical protein